MVLLKRILEITGKTTIKEVWPDFELYIHGGVSFTPYKEQFEKIIGPGCKYIEIYNASEGFFAAQDNIEEDGMLLFLDHGIFYEFMPIEEYGKAQPKTIDQYRDWETDRKSTRLNSSHLKLSRMPSSA